MLHLGFLEYAHYIVTVRFYGLGSFEERYHIRELQFYVRIIWNILNHVSTLISVMLLKVQDLQPSIYPNRDLVQVYLSADHHDVHSKTEHLLGYVLL